VNPLNVSSMAWHQTITDRLADILKFCARGAILISSIACAFTATYIVLKLCYFTARWLDKVIFVKPW
jgi:hypothetical protein